MGTNPSNYVIQATAENVSVELNVYSTGYSFWIGGGTSATHVEEQETGFGIKIGDKLVKAVYDQEVVYAEITYQQYKMSTVSFKAGDEFTLYDYSNQATWIVTLDAASFGGHTDEYVSIVNNKYVVLQDFTADLYLKLAYEHDNIYIGLVTPEPPQKTLESISLAGPTKTEYEVGDELDLAGLVVTAHYDDSSEEVIASGYTTSGFDSSAAADSQTITVTYQGKTATFNVTISEPAPIVAIDYYLVGSVNEWTISDSYKLIKINANQYRISGVVLDAGTTLKIKSSEAEWFKNESTWDNCGFTIDGEGNVVVTESGSYVIDFYIVAENNNHIVLSPAGSAPVVVTNVEIKSAPTKTQYEVGEELDTTGLVLTVYYSNETSEDITTGFTVTGFDSSAAVESQTITVTFADHSDTFTIKIVEPTPEKVTVTLKCPVDVGYGYRLYLVGSFSNWKINEHAIAFDYDGEIPGWKATFEVDAGTTFECKLVTSPYDDPEEDPYFWEADPNRVLTFNTNTTLTLYWQQG